MNFLIFGFGLLVTMLVGGGLAMVIVAKNRALHEESGSNLRPLPVRQEDS